MQSEFGQTSGGPSHVDRRGAFHCAVHPPSIGMAVPVMLCASGAQSQHASLAISVGDDSLRDGCFSATNDASASWLDNPNSLLRSAICGPRRSVFTQPGQMQLTVIPPLAALPAGAYSSA